MSVVYKYKIGQEVLIRMGRFTKRAKIKKGEYKKVIVVSKTSAGGIKQYGTTGGFRKETDIYPI